MLHRDISVHNISIYWYRDSQGVLRAKGLLIDWGLCKYMRDLAKPPSQLSRSVSRNYLRQGSITQCLSRGHVNSFPQYSSSLGRFRHAVWHDLESFIHVHVLHWMCFRFHLTQYSDEPAVVLQRRIHHIYDAYNRNDDGDSIGGEAKLTFLREGKIPFELRSGSAADSIHCSQR